MLSTGQLKDFISKTSEVLQSDKLNLQFYGSAEASNMFANFNEKHRMIPWIQSKGFGAALIEFSFPVKAEDYLLGNHFELVRRKRRAAMKNGFQFKTVKALDYMTDMLEINRSAPERQGKAIPDFFVDEAQVRVLL